MPNADASFRAAVIQAAPVFMDRDATIDKACELILEAGANGARLVAFPESFVPTYPVWVWAVPPREQDTLSELYNEFLANAVTIPSDPLDKLCRIVRRAKTFVVLGITEREMGATGSALYSTLVFIDAQGQIRGKHRKLVSRGGEHLVWAEGDGSTLNVYDTPWGKVGGLIGSENYLPLARCALYGWGAQIYIAPRWGGSSQWLPTLRHIAIEGLVYVLGPSAAFQYGDIPDRYEFKHKFDSRPEEWLGSGGVIVNPTGDLVANAPISTPEIAYAEIDPREMRGLKWILDVAGHHARPDVFQLLINRAPASLMRDQAPSQLNSIETEHSDRSEHGI